MSSNHKKNWSDKKKIEVVTSYLALGKAPMVEAVTGVPSQTIRIWKMQQWWKDLVREIQTSEDQELDGKLSKIIDKSIDVINDRLQNGDFILDSRSGTIKRVPVKLRDTHRVTTDLLDKRNVLRGKPTSITERISTEDVLKKLAQQFQEFTKFKQTRLIEGDVVDALYEERPSGLQDGEQNVQLSSPDEEETGSPKQSAPGDGAKIGQECDLGCGSHEAPFERRVESVIQSSGNVSASESVI